MRWRADPGGWQANSVAVWAYDWVAMSTASPGTITMPRTS